MDFSQLRTLVDRHTNYNSRVANALSKDQQTVTLNDLETDQYFQAHY